METGGVWTVAGDPTEGALLGAGVKRGIERGRLEAELAVERWIPFSSGPSDGGRRRLAAGFAVARFVLSSRAFT